jgi:hypothetical protein
MTNDRERRMSELRAAVRMDIPGFVDLVDQMRKQHRRLVRFYARQRRRAARKQKRKRD